MGFYSGNRYYLETELIKQDLEYRLPIDFFPLLEKENYTINELLILIYDFYGNKTILDFVDTYLTKWKAAFTKKYNIATNKAVCVTTEKRHHIYNGQINEQEIIDEFTINIHSYQNKGFKDAELGNNYVVADLIDNAQMLIDIEAMRSNEKQFKEKKNFANLYDKLLNLEKYIEGFAHSHFLLWLDNYPNNITVGGPTTTDDKEFKGLPEHLYNELPYNLLNTLNDTNYTPEAIWAIVLEYYKDIYLQDLVQNNLKNWTIDFEKRIINSSDIKTFLSIERKKHDYRLIEWEYAQDYQRIQYVGFNWAIEGKSESIGYLLENNEIKWHYNKSIDRHSYDDLLDRFGLLDNIMTGYSHAVFLNKINGHYPKQYLNSLKQKTEDIKNIEVHERKTQKLRWLGTPAQLGFIISLLENKGYLTLTVSSEKNAEILLSILEIESTKGKTSKESLGKVFQNIKKDIKPINAEDAAKFYRNFPQRNELKK